MPINKSIEEEYFEWLYERVCHGRAHAKLSYIDLFTLLHQIEFTYTIRNDSNRAKDGIDLREEYAVEVGRDEIADAIDGPCSVLEMMIALSIRCETIMDDFRYGDRTSQWFWSMISSLGLNGMNDMYFDKKYVEGVIYDFLDRNYRPDGRGGLFYIRDCEDDLRDVEIWTQMCWYLDKIA